MKKYKILDAGCWILVITMIISGCSVHKNMSSGSASFDSSYIKQLEQDIHSLQLENEHLTSKISEMEYTGVVFDNDCDSILKAALMNAGCNVDSINSVLATYKSRVKYYADGSFELEGNLRSVTRTKSKLEETVRDLSRIKDSLIHVIEHTEAKVETKTEWKERVVKRGISGLMWTLFVLLIIAAFILGFWLCWKYKDAIQEQLDSEER
jgi:hypothetical protein